MSARFATGPFEILIQKTWFGVELIDPVNAQTISQGLVVKLVGNDTKPIRSPSGRFGWLLPAAPFPQTVRVEDEERRYAKRDYVIDPPPALPPPRPTAALFPLLLEHAASFSYDGDLTLLRGQLIETRPAPNTQPRGVDNARVWLRWSDVSGPATVNAPASWTGTQGHFACALPVPAGRKPRRVPGDTAIAVRLIIERPGATPGAQHKNFSVAGGLREARTTPLANPLFWDEL